MDISNYINSLIAIMNEMSPYILLGFLLAGILHVFVRSETMSRHLAGKGLLPVIKAAILGIPLPLCSCSVLPTAVSLRRNGASKGASTSFLIATPQTGVDSIAATYSLLGLPFAIIRPIAAFVGAIAGGYAVSKLDQDEESSMQVNNCSADSEPDVNAGWGTKIIAAVKYGMVDMVGSLGKWLVIGLFVAAAITVFVPDTLFLELNRYPLLAMIVMVAVAVPMYVCATGSIPIALSLMMKGLSPGVAFVLLMAGPAANFASVMILSRSHGKRTTMIYVASVVVTSIAVGLMMDYLMPVSWFTLPMSMADGCCHKDVSYFQITCSIVLACLLIYSTIIRRHSHNHESLDQQLNINNMKKEYRIKGMMCNHCSSRVEKLLSELQGAESVSVDLGKGLATVTGDVAPEKVIETISLAGYEYCPE